MENRDKYLLDKYYDIDNNVIENHEYYSQNIDKYQKGTIEYADNILFIMRCELLMGKYRFINEHFTDVLDIYVKNSDIVGEFFTLSTYGLSCRDSKNIPEATLALNKAHKISHETNIFELTVAGIINFICLDLENEITDETLKVFEDTQEYVTKLDHQKIIGSYYMNYGYLLFTTGEIEKAKAHYDKAFEAYSKFYTNKNASNLLAIKSNVAEIHLALEEYDEAIKLYKEAYKIAKKIKDNSIAYDCLVGLEKAYQKIGDYQNAYDCLKLINERIHSIIELPNSRENFSKFNKYLSSELEETKERLVLYNLELKQKTLELEENIKQLRIISKIGKKLTSITNEIDLFESIVDILYDSVKVNTAGLILVDESNRTVNLKYIVEYDKKIQKDYILSFDNTHSFASYCARENKDIFIKNLEKEYYNYIDKTGISTDLETAEDISGSLIFCRLMSDDKMIGILTIQSDYNDTFNDTIYETMLSISSYVAIALSNSNKSKLLKNLSLYDELTGLQNRRAFVNHTEYLKENTESYKSIGLVLADMNHLKLVNDNLGHIEGDRHLISIADILKKHSNNYEIYRHGGDEFAIIMTNVDEEEITQYIDTIRRACDDKKFKPYPLSIAIGYKYSNKKIDVTTFFKDAENEMYNDKVKFYENCQYNRRKPV